MTALREDTDAPLSILPSTLDVGMGRYVRPNSDRVSEAGITNIRVDDEQNDLNSVDVGGGQVLSVLSQTAASGVMSTQASAQTLSHIEFTFK